MKQVDFYCNRCKCSMLNILERITDPAMRALAMKQLKCIVEI